MAKRKRLLISEIDSVGAVDAGDNPPAGILFWKRKRTPDTGEETRKGVLMPDEGIAEAESETAAVVEVVSEEVVEVGKQEPEAEAGTVEEVDDVAKRQAEEVAKAVAERDAAIQALAEEVNKRETAEWVEKAKPYELLLGDPQTIGPELRKIANALPDVWEKLAPVLTAACNREHLGKILAELGTDGGTADPAASREAYVREMRKLHPDMTVAEARARFWQEHPEAVKASREGV